MRKSSEGLYVGLTNLILPDDVVWDDYDLGDGLRIRRTFAHLMVSNTIAFAPPSKAGTHHPGPWKATSGHNSFDVHSELFVPNDYKGPGLSHLEVARVVTVMIRLICDPRVRLLFRANHSLSTVANMADADVCIVPIESTPMFLNLEFGDPHDTDAAAGRLYWVREYWKNAVELMATQADFRLAMEAFELSTFIPHHALTLVSLWGALEALFSPSTSELRFRVSVLIASYLHPPGQARADLQKEVFDLYDKRSAAAHGKPKHNVDHLLKTFNIVRRVLIRMIEEREVPSKAALNNMLLGVE